MKPGYVYIARLLDYKGEPLNNWVKIGKSIDYLVREKALNSTKLPFDAVMFRAFKAEDMDLIESMLHEAFVDYRIHKSNEARPTEWFDVDDIDTFNSRIDKWKSMLKIEEVDIERGIANSTTMTNSEKEVEKSLYQKTKVKKLLATIDGQEIGGENQLEVFIRTIRAIIGRVGEEGVLNFRFSSFGDSPVVCKERSDFIGVRAFLTEESLSGEVKNPKGDSVKPLDHLWVYTYFNIDSKVSYINKLASEFGLNVVATAQ